MRALRYALGPLVAVALAAPAWAGEVYVIETSQGSKPIAVKKDTAALAAVPNIGEGRPNQGFNYGRLYELPGAGIQVMRGHVDPKGDCRSRWSAAIHSLRDCRHRQADFERQRRGTDRRSHLQAGRCDRVSAAYTARLGQRGRAFEFLGFDMPVLRK